MSRPYRVRSSAKRLSLPLSGLMILLCAGCQSLMWFQPRVPKAPVVFQSMPTSDQLVANIEKNTHAVQQLSSRVKVVMDGMPASANGTLLLERPRRLRLKVGLLGMTGSGIDIGSNEERFWIFNKSSLGGQTPTIYFARHHDYETSSLRQSLQLEPQWLFDAMGLLEFDPAEHVDGPFVRNGFVELHVTMPSSTGNMKRILTVDPKSGVIRQQAVYDSSNRLVAWAKSEKHRYFPDYDANLPQYIELNMVAPDGGTTKLSMQMHSHQINSLYVDPAITWSMPTPGDVPQVDLNTVDPSVMNQLSATPGPAQRSALPAPDSRQRPFQLGHLRGFDLR